MYSRCSGVPSAAAVGLKYPGTFTGDVGMMGESEVVTIIDRTARRAPVLRDDAVMHFVANIRPRDSSLYDCRASLVGWACACDCYSPVHQRGMGCGAKRYKYNCESAWTQGQFTGILQSSAMR